MANKYSELSDFEIERLLAEITSEKTIEKGIAGDVFIPKIGSRYEDAFDLMICSDISLNVGIDCDTVYTAIAPKFRNYDIQVLSNDPCRAIAECFLLMKDAENKDG